MKTIEIKGARVNNLKNVSLSIPQNKITCFVGPSGSGKSSLAFHTLYAESKRRFLNSFPTYLKFFSDRPAPVDVDSIEPVLPVFGLPQINPVMGTRSNVADIIQLTNHSQNLYYHESTHICPTHKVALEEFNIDSYLVKSLKGVAESNIFHVLILSNQFRNYYNNLPYPTRSLKSAKSKKINDFNEEDLYWELFRFKGKNIGKLEEKFRPFMRYECDIIILNIDTGKVIKVPSSVEPSCPECDYSQSKNISAKNFSSYNALGSCSYCNGFGATLEYDPVKYLDYSKSFTDGAMKLVESKRFSTHKAEFKKFLKRNKVSLSSKPSELSEDVFAKMHEGEGSWYGINKFFAYLERKKYKAPVRIFMRSIQTEEQCTECFGSRLNKAVHNFTLNTPKKILLVDIWGMTISELYEYFKGFKSSKNKASKEAYEKISQALKTACDIGLGHLAVNRKTKSLSSGEYQRLLLLKYLSYEGTECLFIFDEPSLGLSKSEVKQLFEGFERLIKQKNTVIIIEHNKQIIEKSDYIVQMGPEAGAKGGDVIHVGTKALLPKETLSLDALKITKSKREWITVNRPVAFEKEFSSFRLPFNEFTIVNGPSGSGKTSSLVNVLAVELERRLGQESLKVEAGSFKSIELSQEIDSVVVIASNLTRYTSRSTVGSLTGLVAMMRRHFQKLPVVKSMGLKDGHFSSNSELGQCPNCSGKGVNVIEMQFLEDVVLECEDCKGKKIKPRYADISDGRKTYYEYLSSPLNEVMENINLTPKFKKVWEFLKLLNLDYLSLNRTVQSLSGGERQRLYLLSKLTQKLENNLIIFENISFGLSDLEKNKMGVLLQKLSITNTVVAIDQCEVLEKAASYQIKFK